MRVVGVMLDSPLATLRVGHRAVGDMALDALAGLETVTWEHLPPDAYVVIHDPACPTVDAGFVAELVERCGSSGTPQAAILAVTDTVKAVDGRVVGDTLDRDELALVASPIVLPPGLRPQARDVLGIVSELRALGPVDLVPAPSGSVRLDGPDDVLLLTAALAL